MAQEKETKNPSEMNLPHKTQVMADHRQINLHQEMHHVASKAGKGHKTEGLDKPIRPVL